MAGESLQHGDICTNLVAALHSQLRGTPCCVLSKGMKVRTGPPPTTRLATKGLFSYPDVVVVCGDPAFHDDHRDILLNPIAIIQVASPSTQAFDWHEKWLRYQIWLPSLTHYVLVAQSRPWIESFRRQPDKPWLYSSVHGLAASLHLDAIDCTLRLADVYGRVAFPDESVEGIDAE
jgi:Uma2 family endonuclease